MDKIFGSDSDDGSPPELPHLFARIIGVLDIVACACLVLYTLLSPRDPATAGLGIAFVWVIMMLFAATALPGLLLALRERAPRSALALAIAFPVGFMLLYGALQAVAAIR